MKETAVIILNWNGWKMMEKYLPSVIAYSKDDADVIVADNASTDGSVENLKKKFPDVKLILFQKNYGFAEGYNKAIEQVNHHYIVLLNSDVEVTPGWIVPLVSVLSNNPEVAACQPKLLSLRSKHYFEYAGASGGYIDKYGYPFCRGRIFNTVEKDQKQYDEPADILWATGACLVIKRDDYINAGGLDGRFFAHNEEIDLCWRLRLAGKRIVCQPESVVYHLGGGTLPKDNPMKTFLNFRNNLTMLYKNLPDAQLKKVMRARFWLDYLAAFQFLLSRHWGDFKAVFKARKAFKRWRHDFDADRKYIQQHAVNPTPAECVPYSILWNYYVRGIHTFSKLKH